MDEKTRIAYNLVMKFVLNKYGVREEQILSKSRREMVVRARQVSFAILRKYGLPFNQIGHLMNRDHTTVVHGVKKSLNFKEEVEEYKFVAGEGVSEIDFSAARNPYSKGHSKKWRWLYELYEGKCAICGFSDVTQIHHIMPRSIGGTDDSSNLILLCPNHHALHHLGLVDINKIKLRYSHVRPP